MMRVLVGFLALLALVAGGSVFDYEAVLDGKTVSLSAYKDSRVVIIVNVASKCGHTHSNYRDLRELYETYHEKGLQVLAFPSNQFAGQEPGTDEDIQAFCKGYGVNFPVFSKIDVNGPKVHPLFTYLKKKTGSTEVSWNFVKFLVVDGEPVKRYGSDVKPKAMEADIRKYLRLSDDEL
ncbi:glutathione peroxidase [Ochromonadaceae sp. CCMP2298]|nr:glutathione peroxidase [Ochromonadaceae sp. CCMP2298]